MLEIEKKERLLKIIILDESEPSVQSADRTKAVHVWSWGSMYSPKPGNWQQLGSENKYIASSEGFCGFHARENPSEATISESSQIKELHEAINF